MSLGPVTRSSKMACQQRWDRDLVGPERSEGLRLISEMK